MKVEKLTEEATDFGSGAKRRRRSSDPLVRDSYRGYSIYSSKFYGLNKDVIIIGAPGYNFTGQVRQAKHNVVIILHFFRYILIT